MGEFLLEWMKVTGVTLLFLAIMFLLIAVPIFVGTYFGIVWLCITVFLEFTLTFAFAAFFGNDA